MAELSVSGATRGDAELAMATLELAFSSDPVMRWFWPDPTVYRAAFSRFIDIVAGRAFDEGTAFWLDGGRAVALWLAPGDAVDDEQLVTIMLETVAPELLADLSSFADAVQGFHPTAEHWYLAATGVDPFVQGRGHGSTLLAHALDACDREGLPAYLEASTPRSRVLYERFGFTQVGVAQAGSSPTVWPMYREPGGPGSGPRT